MVKVYLAARFSRKQELAEVADRLRTIDLDNIATWVTGAHDYTGVPDEHIPVQAQAEFAAEDLAEIHRADMVIVFTDEPGQGGSRGGKHFEAGFALALQKPMVIIGPLENVFFSYLATREHRARHYDDLDTFIDDWRAYAGFRRSHWHKFERFMPWP